MAQESLIWEFNLSTTQVTYSGQSNSSTTFDLYVVSPKPTNFTHWMGNQAADDLEEMSRFCHDTFGDPYDFDGGLVWNRSVLGGFMFADERHRMLFLLRFKGV